MLKIGRNVSAKECVLLKLQKDLSKFSSYYFIVQNRVTLSSIPLKGEGELNDHVWFRLWSWS
jgi:hypothetical protein